MDEAITTVYPAELIHSLKTLNKGFWFQYGSCELHGVWCWQQCLIILFTLSYALDFTPHPPTHAFHQLPSLFLIFSWTYAEGNEWPVLQEVANVFLFESLLNLDNMSHRRHIVTLKEHLTTLTEYQWNIFTAVISCFWACMMKFCRVDLSYRKKAGTWKLIAKLIWCIVL